MQGYEKDSADDMWRKLRGRRLFCGDGFSRFESLDGVPYNWDDLDLQNVLMQYAIDMYRIYTRGTQQSVQFSFSKGKWAAFTEEGQRLFQDLSEQSEQISKYVNSYATILALDIIERCTKGFEQ